MLSAKAEGIAILAGEGRFCDGNVHVVTCNAEGEVFSPLNADP